MNQALLVAAFVACTLTARIDGLSPPLRDAGAEFWTMAQTDTAITRTADTEITAGEAPLLHLPGSSRRSPTPGLLRQWMSAAGRELVECQVDFRPGRQLSLRVPVVQGSDVGDGGHLSRGRSRKPHRRTPRCTTGTDWEPLVTTTVLRDDGGGTTLEMTIRYPSKEICDKDFPNVESGSADGFTRLEQLLGSIPP